MPRPGPSFWAPSSTRSYQRYVDFLIAAPGYSAPFQVLLALFYGVEVAYTVARVGPSRGPGAVRRVYRPVDP
ncbi:MAG: hypothetical protein IIB36_03115 [Gemmatimonadetes bacterium]|nr:hypothetical protein [Gemmatimonadota bacterium]